MDYKTYLKYTAKLSIQSLIGTGLIVGGLYLYAAYDHHKDRMNHLEFAVTELEEKVDDISSHCWVYEKKCKEKSI